MAAITGTLIAGGLALKKAKDEKKIASRSIKAQELDAQARLEEARAAQAAAAPAPAPAPVYQQYGYAPTPYQAPAPAAYTAGPSYYGDPGMPSAAGMKEYGGGRRARTERTREPDQRAAQLVVLRQQITDRLSQFRSARSNAERNYQQAHQSRDAAGAQAWAQYYNEVNAAIATLESQQIQYAA